MRYLVPLFNDQINGKLQANEGRITVILPNYTRVYPEADGFKTEDGNLKIYTIEVPERLVDVVKNGDVEEHLLWNGVKGRRDNVADFLSLPIASLVELK